MICFLIVFAACHSKSKQEEILDEFKKLDESLQKSTAAIDTAGRKLVSSLNEKFPGSANAQADSLSLYIDRLKEELKAYAVQHNPGKVEEETFTDIQASDQLMIENKKADTLFLLLTDFRTAFVDGGITAEEKQKRKAYFGSGSFDNSASFKESYFKGVPTMAALTVLSAFQNKIKNALNYHASNALKTRRK